MTDSQPQTPVYNPYAKKGKRNSSIPVVSQCSQESYLTDPELKAEAPRKRKFVPNPYAEKKNQTDDEFNSIDDTSLVAALEIAERQRQKLTPRAKDDDLFDNDGLDEATLVRALDVAEQTAKKKRDGDSAVLWSVEAPTRVAIVVAIVTPAKPSPLPNAYQTPQIMPSVNNVQRKKVTPPTMRDPEVGELQADSNPSSQSSQAWNSGGASSRVLETTTFQPRNLFSFAVLQHMDADDMSTLTTDDPIVSSQESFVQQQPESSEDRQLKLRLASMATGLEKVLKRKFPNVARPTDSLMSCIDRLRRKYLIPQDLADATSDIRWLGYIAAHRERSKLPTRKQIDLKIRNYQELRKKYSNRL